jgi:hypothetical protein
VKFKIAGGAEFETLTKHELEETLHAWTVELGRGTKYRRIGGQAAVNGGALSIGGPAGGPGTGEMGPSDGFVWSVRRLAVVGLTGTDAVSLYTNEAQPLSLVRTLSAPWSYEWGSGVWVLYPGDAILVAAASGLAATGTIIVTGQVEEVPHMNVWTL